jgi:hypothetical protein
MLSPASSSNRSYLTISVPSENLDGPAQGIAFILNTLSTSGFSNSSNSHFDIDGAANEATRQVNRSNNQCRYYRIKRIIVLEKGAFSACQKR